MRRIKKSGKDGGINTHGRRRLPRSGGGIQGDNVPNGNQDKDGEAPAKSKGVYTDVDGRRRYRSPYPRGCCPKNGIGARYHGGILPSEFYVGCRTRSGKCGNVVAHEEDNNSPERELLIAVLITAMNDASYGFRYETFEEGARSYREKKEIVRDAREWIFNDCYCTDGFSLRGIAEELFDGDPQGFIKAVRDRVDWAVQNRRVAVVGQRRGIKREAEQC